jgi:hypothetical protein
MNAVEKIQMEATIRGMIGPERRGNSVIVEGRRIPHLTCFEHPESISFVLDGRWQINVPREMATTVAWFVANAMAVGEGYAFLGSETKGRPFAPQVHCLGSIDDDGFHPAPAPPKGPSE